MENKTKMSTVLGYGLGSMVRTGENLFGFYLIYFLTTVVGINAAIAGSISGITLLVASIACIFIGYASDNSKSKGGKRRPFMILTIIPVAILMTLIFIKVDFGSATVAYYAIVCILFYVLYYGFLVPYDALGAELTVDYDARTKIRSICTAVLYISVFVGGTVVMYAQTYFSRSSGDSYSWTYAVALVCSLPMLICGFIAWKVTKGQEPTGDDIDDSQGSGENIFKSYVSVLKIKPFAALAAWSILYFTGNTIIAGSLVYYGVYVLGITEGSASTYFTISMIATLVAIAPGNFIAGKFGKKKALIGAMFVFIVTAIVIYIKGSTGYMDGCALAIAYGVTNSIALICSYAMVYDLGELNEFVLGESKTAAALGTYTFGMGIAQAIGYAGVGYVLDFSGFDAAVLEQSESVTKAIIGLQTLIPIIFLVLSMLVLSFYRINKTNYNALVKALEAKREGKEYSTEGFESLL